MDIKHHEGVGFRHGRSVMEAYEVDKGGPESMAFLYGMMCAFARFNTTRRGAEDTFNLLTHIAEHEISPAVSLKCIEAEISAALRKGMGA